MTKKSKIAIWILFVLALAAQVFTVIMYIDSVSVINSQSGEALALIALLPLFIIGAVAELIFAIILAVVCKKTSKSLALEQNKMPKLYTILKIIALAFIAVNVLLFVSFYVF